jgi:large subunit ribosomal protein L28
MSRVCDICGKRPLAANSVARRGKPKREKGVGSRVVKRSRRKQYPNLQTVRTSLNGHTRKLRVCTKCLKAGKVSRA